MKTYNLVEAAQLLGVSLPTLRRWRRSAGGVGARGTADGRRVWLTRADLVVLAREHGCVLLDAGAPCADVVELACEVAALRLVVGDLRGRVVELETSFPSRQIGDAL